MTAFRIQKPADIPCFSITGTHYETGYFVGVKNASRIREIVQNHQNLHLKMLPFLKQPKGLSRFLEFIDVHERMYPDYMQELKGMADGSQSRFEDLFLINLRGEYLPFDEDDAGGGCSTVTIVNRDRQIIGHNEDAAADYRDKLFFLTVKPEKGVSWTALCYPGILSGNAAGWNECGIFFTINITAPRQVRVGPGRYFAARSLLEATSLDDAIKRVTLPGRASGFNYTIATTDPPQVVNIEVTDTKHHIKPIEGYYFHTNHYFELPGIDQLTTHSSKFRLIRGRHHIARTTPDNVSDILHILQDKKYIFRQAVKPHETATLMTLICELHNKSVHIYS
jgi:predicted choloylglycine hydrolase